MNADIPGGNESNGDQANTPDVADLRTKNIVARRKVESLFNDLAKVTTGTDEERAYIAFGWLGKSDRLASAAQNYDFAANTHSLQGTTAETITGQTLSGALQDPTIPPEITAIYTELYPDVVAKFPVQADEAPAQP